MFDYTIESGVIVRIASGRPHSKNIASNWRMLLEEWSLDCKSGGTTVNNIEEMFAPVMGDIHAYSTSGISHT